MWVTGESMELLETGWGKGWQYVGKMQFLFHVLSIFYPCCFQWCNTGYPYIRARERGKEKD